MGEDKEKVSSPNSNSEIDELIWAEEDGKRKWQRPYNWVEICLLGCLIAWPILLVWAIVKNLAPPGKPKAQTRQG